MSNKEKRKLIAELIELYVKNGYSIEDIVCRPLNYFNFELVQQRIISLEKENES